MRHSKVDAGKEGTALENTGDNQGLFEELEQRLRELMVESQDAQYTEYLKKLLNRLIQEKYQVDLLKVELDRSYQIYQCRMGTGRDRQPLQQSVQKQGVFCHAEQSTTAADPVMQSDTEIGTDPGNHMLMAGETDSGSAATQYFNTLDVKEKRTVSTWQGTAATTVSFTPEPKKVQKKKNAEFTIGAAVLSVVGGIFILAALVTLGMVYMNGFFKGICLYGIALVFLLVSELVLYRRWPMLGTTLSAIGIGGLYLSTAVNYLRLHNFNIWITLGISLVITIFTVLLSWKRESVPYRIIAIIAGYLCFFTVKEGISDTEFLVVSSLILLMNLAAAWMPVRKARKVLDIVHMAANAVFTIVFMYYAIYGCGVSNLSVLIFILSSLILPQLLLVLEYRNCKRQIQTEQQDNVKTKRCTGIVITYYISTFFQGIFMADILSRVIATGTLGDTYCYISSLTVAVMGLAAIAGILLCKCGGWQHVYIFMNMVTFFIYMDAQNILLTVAALVVLLAVAKIMSLKNVRVLRINDLITTVIMCLFIMSPMEGIQIYLLLAALLFSILMIRYWQTAYEILLTGTLVFYLMVHLNLPVLLQLPMAVGVMLVGILLFNNVKRWHGKNILVFNILALTGEAFCFLGLMRPIYWNAYITYLCMLVFGLATIVITFQEKYHMNFKGKQMMLAVFLTYMAFVFQTTLPVVNSILLMVIALVSVGIGFATFRKSVRIYGLVLSLFVCGKLVLYDFFKAPTMQKTLLFFGVGTIALIISTIYIVLEKRNGQKITASFTIEETHSVEQETTVK